MTSLIDERKNEYVPDIDRNNRGFSIAHSNQSLCFPNFHDPLQGIGTCMLYDTKRIQDSYHGKKSHRKIYLKVVPYGPTKILCPTRLRRHLERNKRKEELNISQKKKKPCMLLEMAAAYSMGPFVKGV